MKAVEKRKTLGQFLRFRRERLSPTAAGLPLRSRRRTAGLRREEVAELAGISTAWYTYLEQGREVQPSREALDGIASALHLTTIERDYLYALALPPPPKETVNDEVPLPLQRLLDNFGVYPAYVTGHTWDILAWNQATCRLFTDFGAMPKRERNLVRYVFTDAQLRRMYTDWEGNARRLLAEFRMSFGLDIGEPRFVEIISELLCLSEEFAQWWVKHDVHAQGSGIKDLQHPRVGRLQLEYATFQSNDNPRFTLITYTAVDKVSEEKLYRLASD
jgi:transcriptional regulator with XRE-family HTH domain